MKRTILFNFFALTAMAMLTAWSLPVQAQVIIIQPNQDDSCAISFDEDFNQINIGHYVSKKKNWCGLPAKAACHLPEWDCQGGGLLFFASDQNVVADGPLHNCSGVLFDNASNVSLSNADIDGAFSGISIFGGSNITLNDLSFQGANDILGRALDIQGAQDVKASGLRFKGDFDRVNVASSNGVSVDKSYFELADGAGFSNIFESTDVSFSWIAVKGGIGLLSAFNATDVSLSRIAIKLSGETFLPTVSVFDSSGINVDHVLMDRRDVASAQCVNINGSTDVTIESSACLSDPDNTSGEALVLTQVYGFLVTKNLFDGNSNGFFINSDGYLPNEGEISKNTINITGPYGLFLSAVTEVDVIKNNVTNTLGTGSAGAWYYDELTDGTQLIINFSKNKYSGFALNGECNSIDELCP